MSLYRSKVYPPVISYKGGVGRCAQAKQWGGTLGPWLQKGAEFLLNGHKNAESDAELKSSDAASLVIEHVQENTVPKRQSSRVGPQADPPMYQFSLPHEKKIFQKKLKKLIAQE